jgi:pimeloyl-ACP methyl ester carboxylesterase
MSAGTGSVSTVVVHGLWMPGPDTWLLRRRLNAEGLNSSLFRYPSVRRGLYENAEALARYVERVPGDTVHLVGHSLGGVLIVAMLQRFGCARVSALAGRTADRRPQHRRTRRPAGLEWSPPARHRCRADSDRVRGPDHAVAETARRRRRGRGDAARRRSRSHCRRCFARGAAVVECRLARRAHVSRARQVC